MFVNTLCTVCLSRDRSLLPITETLLSVIYQLIPSFKNKLELCWECTADLKHAIKFQRRYTYSKFYLESYSKNKGRNVVNRSVSNLIITKTSYDYINEELNYQESTNLNNDVNKIKNVASEENIGVFGNKHIKKVTHSRLILSSKNNTRTEVNKHNTKRTRISNKKVRKRKKRVTKTEFTCKQCGHTFLSRGKYEYHLKKHNDKRICMQCNGKFVNKTTLSAHIANKHSTIKKENTKFYCQPCSKFFESISSYRRHQRTSLKHVDIGQWEHVCPSCAKRFRDATEAKTHYDTVHLGQNRHECVQCSRRYCSVRALRAHVKHKHESVQRGGVVCEVCGKTFKTTQVLKCHQKIHIKEKK